MCQAGSTDLFFISETFSLLLYYDDDDYELELHSLALLLLPFCRWTNRNSEKLNDFPKVSQMVGNKMPRSVLK